MCNCLLIVVAIVIGMVFLGGMPIGTAIEVIIGLAILFVFLYVIFALLNGGATAIYAIYSWLTKSSHSQENGDISEKEPKDIAE